MQCQGKRSIIAVAYFFCFYVLLSIPADFIDMFGSKPPTAIVMMNMGGPSTQEEVCVPNTQVEIASNHIYIHAHTFGTYALAYTQKQQAAFKNKHLLQNGKVRNGEREKWRATRTLYRFLLTQTHIH